MTDTRRFRNAGSPLLRVLRNARAVLPRPLGWNDRRPRLVWTGRTVTVRGDVADAERQGAASACALPGRAAGDVEHCLDTFDVTDGGKRLRLSGWAFVSHRPLFRRSISVVLASPSGACRFPARSIGRHDVRQVFGTRWLYHTGFWAVVDLTTLPPGEYGVGLLLECPPLPQSLRTALLDLQPPRPGEAQSRRVLQSLPELDEELEEMARAQQRSFGEWVAMGLQFRLAEDVTALPADPFSPEYREAQLALYRRVAGVDEYNPWKREPIPISVEDSIDPHPFPYSTKDAEHVGNHHISVGFILRALKSAGARGRALLEYGCGTGFTTIILAATGFEVTAVDINAQALQVVDRLAAIRGLRVTTHNGEFGDIPQPDRRYDLVLFYEAFHHCVDFRRLLRRLHELIAKDGAVVFAGEPIFPDFEKPWGLRLDGGALWEIRTKGWFELGFRESFFLDLLDREGWTVTKEVHAPFPDIYIAREKR